MPQSFHALYLASGKRALRAEDKPCNQETACAWASQGWTGLGDSISPGQSLWGARWADPRAVGVTCALQFSAQRLGRDAQRGFARGQFIILITIDHQCWALFLEANAKWAGEILNIQLLIV